VLALSAFLAIGLVITEVTVVLARKGPASAPPSAPAASSGRVAAEPHAALHAATATRGQAAAWIGRQVSEDTIVACDPAMCSALKATGLPADRLLVLEPTAGGPVGSGVVVATPALRSRLGARLDNQYAPLLIASFGSGAGRIDIRAVAPDGAAAFESALASDRRARIAAGAQLLRNGAISVSAAARAALAAGRVDTRLLVTLAALAAQLPVNVVAFGDPSPGAGPAVPFRGAEMGPARTAAGDGKGLPSMLAFLRAQRSPYLPSQVRMVRDGAGQSVLSVQFAAPSPLGLLSGP
jgi:hypothetical protein